MPRHDPLSLMNALLQWPVPPEHDTLWAGKVAACSDLAAAYADLADALDSLCAVYRLGYPRRGAAAAERVNAARARVADLLDALGLNGDWSRKD